ncbi:hypothetical protein C8Q80DRAFT_1297762 [Daedaleopsis nitida]|nr:hypothetical protein C8Q80DRAFT_1297762 [Daedaleopsis nitida]
MAEAPNLATNLTECRRSSIDILPQFGHRLDSGDEPKFTNVFNRRLDATTSSIILISAGPVSLPRLGSVRTVLLRSAKTVMGSLLRVPMAASCRFEPSDLAETIAAMRLALPRRSLDPPSTPPMSPTNALVWDDGSFTDAEFYNMWLGGFPVVVTGLERRLQGRWSPDDFIHDYGSQKVTPVNAMTGEPVKCISSVAAFFGLLKEPKSHTNLLKLKDWPPQKHFRDAYPALFRAFVASIPVACQDIAAVDGVFNLAAHLPSNGIHPDLGRKMYIACGSPDDDTYGMTCLHLDVTDAFNLTVWCYDHSQPAAIWHIFPADSVDALSVFLQEIEREYAAEDPIHSQRFYLSDVLLVRLVLQHNVRNLQNAMKIACDFVSVHNLKRTMSLVTSQRRHRLRSQGPDDLLHVQSLLWYTWLSASVHSGRSVSKNWHPDIYNGAGEKQLRKDGKLDPDRFRSRLATHYKILPQNGSPELIEEVARLRWGSPTKFKLNAAAMPAALFPNEEQILSNLQSCYDGFRSRLS